METQLPNLSGDLETAFEDAGLEWLDLAREMSREPPCTALARDVLRHQRVGFRRDAGLRGSAQNMESDDATILAVCDDPWLFRHLSETVALRAGRLAGLRPSTATCLARPVARTSYAMSIGGLLSAAIPSTQPQSPWRLLVGVWPPAQRRDRGGRILRRSAETARSSGPRPSRRLRATKGEGTGSDGRTVSLRAWAMRFQRFRYPFAAGDRVRSLWAGHTVGLCGAARRWKAARPRRRASNGNCGASDPG